MRTLEQRISDVKWLAIDDVAALLDVPYSAVYMQTTEPHNMGGYNVTPLLIAVVVRDERCHEVGVRGTLCKWTAVNGNRIGSWELA